jgi:hypothetical protein
MSLQRHLRLGFYLQQYLPVLDVAPDMGKDQSCAASEYLASALIIAAVS